MEIRDIVNSMLMIEEKLRTFERKYGLKSAEFYRLAKEGQLGDLDGREDTSDLLEWLGLYELWLDCKEEYDELINSTPNLAQVLAATPVPG